MLVKRIPIVQRIGINELNAPILCITLIQISIYCLLNFAAR